MMSCLRSMCSEVYIWELWVLRMKELNVKAITSGRNCKAFINVHFFSNDVSRKPLQTQDKLTQLKGRCHIGQRHRRIRASGLRPRDPMICFGENVDLWTMPGDHHYSQH